MPTAAWTPQAQSELDEILYHIAVRAAPGDVRAELLPDSTDGG
jgi:hypothetical protein